MIGQDRLFACKSNVYWRDRGTAATFYETNMESVRQQERFSPDGRRFIFTGEHASSELGGLETGSIVNSIISPDCVVRGHYVCLPGRLNNANLITSCDF